MKGKIISVPYFHPKKFEQVIYKDEIRTVTNSHEDGAWFELNGSNVSYGMIEVKKLRVEYEQDYEPEWLGQSADPKVMLYRTLRYSDWKYAIDNGLVDSDKEVDVEINERYLIPTEDDSLNIPSNWMDVAELKNKTSERIEGFKKKFSGSQKLYTGEEVINIIKKFCIEHPLERGMQIIGNEVKNWWDKTYKK